LREIKIPFGVNVLWDAKRSLDVAAATGASFIREIMSGVYASDFGIWNTNSGDTVRHRKHLSATNVKLIYNIVPEAAAYLAGRDIRDIARSTQFNCQPDAICVSGLVAGSGVDLGTLKAVKETVPEAILLSNTGVNIDTVEQHLSISDGAIVGTTFKKDGKFANHVDGGRVRAFMDKVKEFRAKLPAGA
jgi:membrane complex biogenesis BtpA family protein